MERRIHFYVSNRNVLTWLMALCMVCSAVARIALSGVKGAGDPLYVWSQIVLPVAAAVLYVLIVLLNGREMFYKTAIPVWMVAIYSGIWVRSNIDSGLITWLFWIALFFFAFMYTEITSGARKITSLLLLIVAGAPLAVILYYQREALMNGDLSSLPDILMLVGVLVLVFAIRISPAGEYHPTWGDRPDGRRVRTLSPMAQITAYFQVERNTCSNLFEESLCLSFANNCWVVN